MRGRIICICIYICIYIGGITNGAYGCRTNWLRHACWFGVGQLWQLASHYAQSDLPHLPPRLLVYI